MKNPARSILMDVLPMADCQTLSVTQACERFVVMSTQSGRAFSAMGKLHYALGKMLKTAKSRTIYGELRKLGVSNSTISNASFASKVWEMLVNTNTITEAIYDRLTFAGCRDLCRVLGISGNKPETKILKPEEVKLVIDRFPSSFEDEFESLAESGLSCVERETAAIAAATAKVEADKVKAATPAVTTAAEPVTTGATPAATTAAEPAVTTGATPAVTTAKAATVVKTKAVAAAPAVPTLVEVLVTLDAVESAIGKLSAEDQLKAVERIVELADLLTVPAKAAPAKTAKVAAKAAK
jgi:hypothetical protein